MQEILSRFDDNFEKALIDRINQYDAIDLLSKVSSGSFFLRTSLFEDDSRKDYATYLDKSTIYLTSLFITKGMNKTGNIINYDELISLSKDISMLMLAKGNKTDSDIMAITMCQNSKSEVLEKFKYYAIKTLFNFERELIKDDGIECIDLLTSDLIKFVINMYGINETVKNKSFDEYINNFNKYNKSEFCYSGTFKSLLSKFSLSCGKHPELYNANSPFYALDILRCCFIEIDNELFCFIPELITSNLLKYFPFYYTKEKKIKWYDNRAIWSEESTKYIFDKYLKGAVVYLNNYFYENSKKNRHENDLLIDYKGFLFIVEVKSSGVSPDPIYENTQKVKESYELQINKGINQCDELEKTFIDKGFIEIFNENNKLKAKLLYKDYNGIFKLVVTFEEMGSFLPGYLIRNKQNSGHIIVNFYDLFVVLDYLSNPALIIKYFQERKQNLFSKCNVHDELVFLGLFTTLTLNYVEWLNDTFNKEKNISNVFLPEIEFMPQIEEYYSNNKSIKPKFAINDLIMRAIDVNFEHISNIEMSHLLLLLNLSAENHKSIEDRYYIPSNKLVLRSYVKDRNCEYALVIKKSKKKCYEICANYFKTHADLSYIVIIYFEGNRAKISTVKRNNQNLKKIYK